MESRQSLSNISNAIFWDQDKELYMKRESHVPGFLHLNANMIKYALGNTPQITFEVTDACNLDCKYCGYGVFYSDHDERKSKMLDIEKAILFLSYMIKLWETEQNNSAAQNIYISFYGGEPLMNMPFIRAIVDYLNQINIPSRKFIFSMTTNAMLLNQHIDYLVEHGFNLLISLDGGRWNNSFRVDLNGNEVFDRIICNVEKLRTKYPKYFDEKVNFNSVLHNRNSVEEIYKFFKEHFLKIPSIGELNDMGITPNMVAEFNRTYRNASESLQQAENYEKIEKDMFMKSDSYVSLAIFLHKYSGFVYHDYMDLLFEKKPIGRIPTGTCVPFAKKVFITVNGKILPCERIGHQFAIGKIADNEVLLDFEAIAKRYNHYFEKLKRQCGICNNQEGCVQCVFNLQNVDNRPVCYGCVNEKQFSQYVAYHMDFISKNPDEYYRVMEEVLVE